MARSGKVKVAVIGAGNMSTTGHCTSLRDMDEVELAGICDLQRDKADAAAQKFGFAAAYTDFRTMLEEAAPDAVYVILPPQALCDVIPYCLEAGVHLFTEKPPGITVTQTRLWARLAEQKGCTTMVGFNRRFIPVLVESRRLVEEHGPIHLCTVTFVKDQQRNYQPHRYGGCDVVYLDAIHAIDALRWLGGDVKVVHPAVRAVEGENPNTFAAMLEYESGALGLLHTSWVAGARVHTFQIHAIGASAYVDADTCARILTRDSDEPTILDAREVAGSDEFYRYYGFFHENRHFVDCLLARTQPQTHFGDAVKTMELCEAIMRGGWR